ncbi:MAG: rhodanese-like domain-containing protein [Anaeromyxobacteraceae bacterium]
MKLPWWFPFGSVPEVAAQALAEELRGAAPPVLLDVRTPAEFARGHVAGARNVPVTVLRERLAALGLAPGTAVVAICLSAHRSPPAVRLLRAAGLEARQLRGGMIAWSSAGLPVVRP